jgi:hypothetical protein
MAEHLVDHHFQAEPMRLGQQAIEIGQRAEQRIDVTVVGNVVAEISHRRLEEWRDPDRIHTEARHIVEPLDDARQIAHAIAVRVEKAARIDLVDDGTAPPGSIGH